MARLALSVTKGNLLKVQEEHGLAVEALTFLEEKRDLLLGEMQRLQKQADRFRRRVEEALETAYGHLTDGFLALGREGVARAALGVASDDAITIKERAFLGMPMPVVEFTPGARRPRFSFGGTVAALDQCHLAVKEVLSQIAELAEVEAILWRLAEELKRTVRRTNALNYMIIPSYRETIHYLESALEERERESLFHLKRVKARKAGLR
ncbi:MAG: V-type ATP synthase subunit D [Deltaproteobacteria bacterium]|nr:V-type ATP synthase subunit D [Deltaproteobacteria bacterium]